MNSQHKDNQKVAAASRKDIGIPVFWGILIGTLGGLFVIPMFYTFVQEKSERFAKWRKKK